MCARSIDVGSHLYRSDLDLHKSEAPDVCAECYLHSGRNGGGIVSTRMHHVLQTGDLEERSAGLLKAARVLLRKGVRDESVIFPTLWLAYRMSCTTSRLFYENVRMVDAVDGVAILQLAKVRVEVHKGRSDLKPATAIHVVVFPHVKATTAEEVARAYEEALREEGESWSKTAGQVRYAFLDDSIKLEVIRLHPKSAGVHKYVAAGWEDEGDWASPNVVGSVARAVIDEFTVRFALRNRGSDMDPQNSIPAMVAYLLHGEFVTDDKKENVRRKDLHRLLNRHVLNEYPWKKLPEEYHDNSSKASQLRWDMYKIAQLDNNFIQPQPVDDPVPPYLYLG